MLSPIHTLRQMAIIASTLGIGAALVTAATIEYANVDPVQCPALESVSAANDLSKFTGEAKPGSLIVWEASAANEIDAARAAQLGEHVRKGGSLLISLDRNTGTGPFRLAFMLPTTAWQSLIQAASRGNPDGEVGVATWNSRIYPAGASPLAKLPYYHKLKPVHAVERGLGRYERFARKQGYVNLELKAGDPWYTRPLINRDWQSWIEADDIARSSLLLTGRYGAGRVAVFASSIRNASPESLKPVIDWLVQASPIDPNQVPKGDSLEMRASQDSDGRVVAVEVSNRSDRDLPLIVIARILSWENAVIGDELREISVPAGKTSSVRLPLPARGPTEYQAISHRDAYVVRLGILSGDGSELLKESRLSVDLTPPLEVRVSTDNLRAKDYPFDAPDYDAQDRSFLRRMGSPVMAYAYPTGDTVKVLASISNGLRNLAPLASAADLTAPENPTIIAVNDEIVHAEKGPRDGTMAYGAWVGTKGVENTLEFVFPEPVTVCGVTLNGAPTEYRFLHRHNPASVRIEADGSVVAEASDLESRFLAEHGLVPIRFAPRKVKSVRLMLKMSNPGQDPWLGDVSIEGTMGEFPPSVRGVLRMVYVDALSGKEQELARQNLQIGGGELRQVAADVSPDCFASGVTPGRIEARFAPTGGEEILAAAPLMTLPRQRSIEPMSQVEPRNSAHMGFIVTRGFRNVFDLGTGNQEMPGGWGTPDDLVWAYARQLKQTSVNAMTKASSLYASEQDLRHYSTPWTHFASGERFFDVAAPLLVERMKKAADWKDASAAVLFFSDRWDTGPSTGLMYTWPEIVAFDEYLATSGKARLTGKTRKQLCKEIDTTHRAEWLSYLTANYIRDVRTMRDAFAAEGRRLIIRAQGIPMIPTQYVSEMSQVIRGMSQDASWGLRYESTPFTTGEQMAIKAQNPGWKLAELLVWGYDSAVLNNPHWYSAVGTTEPSRRLQYDRGWRGCIDESGDYQSIHTYGFSMNASVSWTMADNDWQECWRAQERRSLLYPSAPVGVGVISGSKVDDPLNPVFSGGGMGGGGADKIIDTHAELVRRLQDARLPVAFSSNLANAAKWGGASPMLLADANDLSEPDALALAQLRKRGVRLAALAYKPQFNIEVARQFGVGVDATPVDAKLVSEGEGLKVLEHDGWLLILTPQQDLTIPQADYVVKQFAAKTPMPVVFGEGYAGYGFRMGDQSFVVVEDWMERSRRAEVRILATEGASTASAVGMNDHKSLAVRRDGAYWVISVDMRPGDGEVICMQEMK